MTLPSSTSDVSTTAAGTSSEEFTVPYLFLADADLQVFLAGDRQTLNTNYTVSGAGSSSGGTVTWVGTPTAAATVRIIRVVDATQLADYSESGPFPAETTETALDKVTMLGQQSISRSATDGAKFDAKDDIIDNVATPTASDHAATKGYVDAATFVSNTSIAAPQDPADDTKGLRASGGAVTYEVVLVPPATAADDTAKALIATGDDLFDWHDQYTTNLLYNSDFRVAQRGTTFTAATTPANSNDTWLLDRWLLLSDGNNRADITQEQNTTPIGSFASMKLETETVDVNPNAQKFGIAQILEERDARRLQGRTVSLSFKAWTIANSEIDNIRVGFMEWVSPGVADTVTSAIFQAGQWGTSGSNPLPSTNWGYRNTPANIALTTTRETTYKIEGITLGELILNFAIVIWVDDTDHVAGDSFFLTDIQLEISDIAHPYVPKTIQQDLADCQRYYAKTFDQGTVPADDATFNGALWTTGVGNGSFALNFRYPVVMHRVPDITTYNPTSGTAAAASNATDSSVEPVTVDQIGDAACRIRQTSTVADNATDAITIQASAEAEL